MNAMRLSDFRRDPNRPTLKQRAKALASRTAKILHLPVRPRAYDPGSAFRQSGRFGAFEGNAAARLPGFGDGDGGGFDHPDAELIDAGFEVRALTDTWRELEPELTAAHAEFDRRLREFRRAHPRDTDDTAAIEQFAIESGLRERNTRKLELIDEVTAIGARIIGLPAHTGRGAAAKALLVAFHFIELWDAPFAELDDAEDKALRDFVETVCRLAKVAPPEELPEWQQLNDGDDAKAPRAPVTDQTHAEKVAAYERVRDLANSEIEQLGRTHPAETRLERAKRLVAEASATLDEAERLQAELTQEDATPAAPVEAAPSTDPVFAAIAHHQAAWEALRPVGLAVENDMREKYDAALDALNATVPTTLAGLIALARHWRQYLQAEWNNPEQSMWDAAAHDEYGDVLRHLIGAVEGFGAPTEQPAVEQPAVDPIFAAIARHRAAWAAWQAANEEGGDDGPAQRKYYTALDALIATTPTSVAGIAALARHWREHLQGQPFPDHGTLWDYAANTHGGRQLHNLIGAVERFGAVVAADPVFAAIEAHRKAQTRLSEIEPSDDDHAWQKALDAQLAAYVALTKTPPTTAQGFVALARYLEGHLSTNLGVWPKDETRGLTDCDIALATLFRAAGRVVSG